MDEIDRAFLALATYPGRCVRRDVERHLSGKRNHACRQEFAVSSGTGELFAGCAGGEPEIFDRMNRMVFARM